MVDIAYDYAKNATGPVSFKELWDAVVNELGLSEEEVKTKIGIFYTNLSLDCRFHSAGDNTWVLRASLPFDEATADIFFVKGDLDDELDEEEDEEEEEDTFEDDEEERLNRDEDDTLDIESFDDEDID